MVATPHCGDCSLSDEKPTDEISATGGHQLASHDFYILGGLLVIGAAVVLVARRKAHD